MRIASGLVAELGAAGSLLNDVKVDSCTLITPEICDGRQFARFRVEDGCFTTAGCQNNPVPIASAVTQVDFHNGRGLDRSHRLKTLSAVVSEVCSDRGAKPKFDRHFMCFGIALPGNHRRASYAAVPRVVVSLLNSLHFLCLICMADVGLPYIRKTVEGLGKSVCCCLLFMYGLLVSKR
jgi:hypothetical protein